MKHRRRSPIASALLVAAVPLLLLALVAQAAIHWREVLAAHFPATRPVFASACAVLGCTVRPLRDVAGLSIDASDLQADPAHRGLLILSATLRNRAAWPLAYPHLELTLTDAQDQPVVRRVLAPAEYAGGTIDVATGMPGNGEAGDQAFHRCQRDDAVGLSLVPVLSVAARTMYGASHRHAGAEEKIVIKSISWGVRGTIACGLTRRIPRNSAGIRWMFCSAAQVWRLSARRSHHACAGTAGGALFGCEPPPDQRWPGRWTLAKQALRRRHPMARFSLKATRLFCNAMCARWALDAIRRRFA